MLDRIQQKWLNLYWTAVTDPILNGHKLAAPFLSVADKDYNPGSNRTILYVGKATAGEWYRSDFGNDTTLRSWQDVTRRFLSEQIFEKRYTSAFWKFGWALHEIAPADRPFQNIVWSNIAKIGVTTGNPTGSYLLFQQKLATETLVEEIRYYRPFLVVFVSSDYADEVVREALNTIGASQEDLSWNKLRNDLWWREPTDHLPGLICANHPGYKRAETLQDWLGRAKTLMQMR